MHFSSLLFYQQLLKRKWLALIKSLFNISFANEIREKASFSERWCGCGMGVIVGTVIAARGVTVIRECVSP